MVGINESSITTTFLGLREIDNGRFLQLLNNFPYLEKLECSTLSNLSLLLPSATTTTTTTTNKNISFLLLPTPLNVHIKHLHISDPLSTQTLAVLVIYFRDLEVLGWTLPLNVSFQNNLPSLSLRSLILDCGENSCGDTVLRSLRHWHLPQLLSLKIKSQWNTRFSSWEPLASFSTLTRLNISSTGMTLTTPMPKLVGLETLVLRLWSRSDDHPPLPFLLKLYPRLVKLLCRTEKGSTEWHSSSSCKK